jgi:GAF domain-containing protein
MSREARVKPGIGPDPQGPSGEWGTGGLLQEEDANEVRLQHGGGQHADVSALASDPWAAVRRVLAVLRESHGDLKPVCQSIVQAARAACEADVACLVLRQSGGGTGDAALDPQSADLMAGLTAFSLDAADGEAANGSGGADGSEPGDDGARWLAASGYETRLSFPLRHGETDIGAMALARRAASPFSPRQTEVAATLAELASVAVAQAGLTGRVSDLSDEVQEALAYQEALGGVLSVLSRSPSSLQPVLETIADAARQLCQSFDASIILREGDTMHVTAHKGPIPIDFTDWPVNRDWVTGRAVVDGAPIHIADLSTDNDYPEGSIMARRLGHRTILAVPLLRNDEAIGAIVLRRLEVRPFSDRQVKILQTFADQAVIAIANVRLLEQLRTSTAELTEALHQQTATADVLKVISRSTFDLQTVLDALVETAAQLARADMADIFRKIGGEVRCAATYGYSPELQAYMDSRPWDMSRGTAFGRAAADGRIVHIPDVWADPEYTAVDAYRIGGFRTLVGIPLLREGVLLGLLSLERKRVDPFTDKELELISTFADQAVIAIENVRLFTERADALERQTATAEILKVIASSRSDVQPVFEVIADCAVRLTSCWSMLLTTFDGEFQHFGAARGALPGSEDYVRAQYPVRPEWDSLSGRCILQRTAINTYDAWEDPSPAVRERARARGYRGSLCVPMLLGDACIGALSVSRNTPGRFAEEDVAMLRTFADQAVIAIENVRLFTETTEALQQQTATADVLKVISRSTFDLEAVLQTLVESAARLADADKATITRERDGVFYREESYGFSDQFIGTVRAIPVRPEPGSASGRAMLEGRIVHIPDVLADPAYTFAEALNSGEFRTILAVPMLREKRPIGVFALTRGQMRPFTDKQIELVATFADQAAIAIENVTLFDRVEARTRELAQSLQDLKAAQDRLIQSEKLASLGQLTAGIAHEIKNPLNFVNNFAEVSSELVADLSEILRDVELDDVRSREVADIADALDGNLRKIVQHGARADSIVRNMLLHSRRGTGERRAADINALVEESLGLAYHGARAQTPGFNVSLVRDLDPTAGHAVVDPQEITRVLLNLLSNSFHATAKRKRQEGGGFEPVVTVRTRGLADHIVITVEDNGTGVPPDVRARIFDPFFTTKPAGEGTGLGLSLSHDVVVQHGGVIEVDSDPGAFTAFTITLPRDLQPDDRATP